MSEEINNSQNIIKKNPKRRKILWIGSILIVIISGGGLTALFIMKPWYHDSFPVIEDPLSAIAYANQNIRIDVTCSDDISISSVILSYSTDQVFWSNVTMIGSGTTDWSGYGYIPPHNIEETIYYKIYAIDSAGQVTVEDHNGFYWQVFTGSRKALILNSANDFSGEEPEGIFNGSPDSDFTFETGNWEKNGINMTIIPDLGSGYMVFTKIGGIGGGSANFTFDWIGNGYNIYEYAEYNISADIEVLDPLAVNSTKIGLRWTNSTGIARTDWSDYAPESGGFNQINITSACNNDTNYEITGLTLVVSVNFTGIIPDGPIAHLDNVKIDKWIAVNNTDPTNQGSSPSAPYLDCDGFPAQILQIYWILKNQGYTDENILLMIYNKNDADGKIDIYASWHPLDTTTDDLAGAAVDVANDSVTAARVKWELNISTGGFASQIQPNDQLIIAMTDHGSNVILGDGNATFHFEADNSYITEHEFFGLVKEINCSRMMINIDCCFSGNFIQSNPGVYYDVPNAVLVSASNNVAAWYWINNQNLDGFAGSWFFNPFWEQLSYGIDIMNAFIFAKNFIPFGRKNPVGATQMPLIYDPKNWANTWSFVSNPKL